MNRRGVRQNLVEHRFINKALMVQFEDLPQYADVIISAHAANIPVMLSHNHTSRGYLHIVAVHSPELDPFALAQDFKTFKSTNPLGIFLILHFRYDYNKKRVQDVHRDFYRYLGVTRVIHLFPFKDPLMVFSYGYDTMELEWSVQGIKLPRFCREQLDESTKKLKLNTNVVILKGLVFKYIVREQNVWVDRRGKYHLGGREYEFAKMLKELGMIVKLSDNYLVRELTQEDWDLILPGDKLFFIWYLKDHLRAEYTVVAEQSSDYLVVRRAQQIPFGLVLVMPFQWATWCWLAAIMVLLVLAWTLVRRRRFQVANMVFAGFDVMEMTLTGGILRTTMTSFSMRNVFLCTILLHIIVGHSYRGLFLSFLTAPLYFKELDAISDVVTATDRLYATGNYFLDIRNSQRDDLGKLLTNIKRIRDVTQRDMCIQDIVESGKAATCMDEGIYRVISRFRKYTDDGRIMLHKVNEPIRTISYLAYPVRRNHMIVHVLNSLILRLWQSGLFKHWDDKLHYSLDIDGQRDTTLSGGVVDPEKLTSEQLTGPFVLYGAGLCVAGTVFLLEQVYGRARYRASLGT